MDKIHRLHKEDDRMKIEIYIDNVKNIENDYGNNYFGIIVTSPPYYTASTTPYANLGQYTKEMLEIFEILYKKLRYGRICAVNISDINDGYHGRIPLQNIFYTILEKVGFKYQETIIWAKPSGVKAATYGKRAGSIIQHKKPLYYYPDVIHEYILIYSKGGIQHKPYKGNIRIYKQYLNTIWHINPVSSETNIMPCKHPIAYPIKLPYLILNYYGYRDEPVLDPFLGGGTTILAARKLHFQHAVGYEIDPNQLKCILKNIIHNGIQVPIGIRYISTLGDTIKVVRRK